MNAVKVGKDLGKDYTIFADEGYDFIGDPAFKFVLFGYFCNLKEIPFGDLLLKVAAACKTYKMQNIELNMQEFKKGSDDLEENVPKTLAEASNFYIAGTEKFAKNAKGLLAKIACDPHKIKNI